MSKIENFYVNNFDLFRLVAALLVLFTHCYELLGKLDAEPLFILSSGRLRFSSIGLYCFFFISGYLVSQSFFTTKNLRGFLWKRFLRIYPGLIAVVLITVFIAGPLLTRENVLMYFSDVTTFKYMFTSSGIFIKYFLPGVFSDALHFDHGVNGSLWSIALEIKLYAALVLFGVVSKKLSNYFFFIPILVAFSWSSLVHFDLFHFQDHFDDLHCRLIVIFFIGNLCCVFCKRIVLSTSLLLVIFIIYLATFFVFDQGRYITEPLFFSYLTLFLSYKIPMQKLRMDISYGIYIYAFLITQSCIQLFLLNDPIILSIIVILVAAPVSALSWNFIEKRAISYKKRFN